MNRKLIFAGVVAAIATAAPACAQVAVEMSEITCKQFTDYDPETKDFVANWMRGFFSAKKNLTVVESRYVKRNTEKVLRYCKKVPKASLVTAIEKNAR
jgi:hypothetical protein